MQEVDNQFLTFEQEVEKCSLRPWKEMAANAVDSTLGLSPSCSSHSSLLMEATSSCFIVDPFVVLGIQW